MNILNEKTQTAFNNLESKFLQWQKFSKPIFLLNKFSFKDSVFSLAIRKSRCPKAFPNHQSVFTNSVMESLGHTAELKAVFPSVMDSIRTLLGLLLDSSSIVTLVCFHYLPMPPVFLRQMEKVLLECDEKNTILPIPPHIEDGMQDTDKYKLKEKIRPVKILMDSHTGFQKSQVFFLKLICIFVHYQLLKSTFLFYNSKSLTCVGQHAFICEPTP